MSNNDELKPCKYCGYEHYEIARLHDSGRYTLYVVTCMNCREHLIPVRMEYGFAQDQLYASCLAAWNTENQNEAGHTPDVQSDDCPICNGNDGDRPCAYPSEGKPGCKRDERLHVQSAIDIDRFVRTILDECNCGKACGGLDEDQAHPLSTTQVVLQAIRDSQQAAIDAALREIAEIIAASSRSRLTQEGRVDRDRYLYEQGVGLEIAEKIVYSRIGTNPLADLQAQLDKANARVKELERSLEITRRDHDAMMMDAVRLAEEKSALTAQLAEMTQLAGDLNPSCNKPVEKILEDRRKRAAMKEPDNEPALPGGSA